MIPKIIHQIWEGRTEHLHEPFIQISETWKEHHPEWKYEFWDNSRMNDFVYEYYPEMVGIYFGYQYSIQRWHVIRYLILYQMGGLYADFDYECMESFDKYVTDHSKCYFAMEPAEHFIFSENKILFNNALMIAPPGHPFFKRIITHLQNMTIQYTGNKYLEVLNTTGSMILTNLYEQYPEKNTIEVFPSEQVSPFSRNEVQDYRNGKADEGLLEIKLQKALAVHYFWGSWLIKNDTLSVTEKSLTHKPVSDLYQIYIQYPTICIFNSKYLPDSMFFAVKGNSDGNQLAEEALEAGCRYAIVDDPSVIKDNRYILVDNVLQTLQQLAIYHHNRLKTPVIGITGTCGKTTTKELTSAVLSTKYKIVFTKWTENSSLSISLALLRLKPEHDMAVIEMGAGGPGGIRELSRIAQPSYGIITNVGLAHLEGFGSFEGVIRAKGELYDSLRQSGGKVFIHKENKYLQSIAEGLEQISYGDSKDAFISGQVESMDPYLCFNWEHAGNRHTVSTHLVGEYNIWNALAAIAAGVYFDVPYTEINQAISAYVPTNHRSQRIKTFRNELIIDCFNANPTSMQAALASFFKQHVKPKAVILGDMLELGTESVKLHTEIIEKLKGYSFDKVLLCGDQFSSVVSGYQCFPSVKELGLYLSANPLQGYNVLIKGSNQIQLDIIIDLL